MKKLELSDAEYQQFLVDLEGVAEELEMLSEEVSFFVTDYPDRLRTLLEILGRAE